MKSMPHLMSESNENVTNCIDEWDRNNYGKDTSTKFIDWVKLKVKAGDGGDGKAHLKRGRGLLGPDGGDGGKGGDVIVVADQSVKHLKGLKKHYRAQNGGNGQVDYCTGKKGNDLIIRVPVGTMVKNQVTKEILADLVTEGNSCVLVRGGFGGLGNANFKSSTDQRTLESTNGEPGEELLIELDMKTIADVGLVGFPNAGKSTLLRALSRARPAVASYPFTTLKPYIGIIVYKDMAHIAVADIPGLVEDAHLNRGLGHLFLRHIERCSSLLYVVDVSEDNFVGTYLTLNKELAKYDPKLLTLPSIIVANKIDQVDDYGKRIDSLKCQADFPVIGISGRNLINTEKLKIIIRKLVSSMKDL